MAEHNVVPHVRGFPDEASTEMTAPGADGFLGRFALECPVVQVGMAGGVAGVGSPALCLPRGSVGCHGTLVYRQRALVPA